MKNTFFKTTITILTLSTTNLFAAELLYRYKEVAGGYQCVDANNQEGRNTGFMDECGQVSGMKFDALSVHTKIAGLQSIGAAYFDTDFSGTFFLDCDFSNSKMEHADLNQVLIRRSNWSGAGLSQMSLKGSWIAQTSFSGSDLNFAVFSNSTIARTKFDRANLRSANFQSSLMGRIDFSEANLNRANFSNAHLTAVDFQGADLRGANFTGALVADDVSWERALYDRTTVLPFSFERASERGMVFFPQ